ncbi:hypothetical protein KF7HA_02002 [Lactococcus lactis]|nr:hypothetical protein [Lactococcus lactis]
MQNYGSLELLQTVNNPFGGQSNYTVIIMMFSRSRSNVISFVDQNRKYKKYLTRIKVLTGGADVSPYLYGEEPNAKLGTTDPIRDRFELPPQASQNK